jgi:hypothetical protein
MTTIASRIDHAQHRRVAQAQPRPDRPPKRESPDGELERARRERDLATLSKSRAAADCAHAKPRNDNSHEGESDE